MMQAVLDCESIRKVCNCGRMAKSRGVGQTCTRLCRCVNCKNASQVEKSPYCQHKGCTCGSMKNVKSAFVTCKDTLKGSQDVPVYVLVQNVPALVDVPTAEITRTALTKGAPTSQASRGKGVIQKNTNE
ncbi:hypothetical protein OS493_034081 [Desmophyllum pertusum]|uniref:Uncharacterized protein n=1 Tax=Desmophyllum pertusum TaxID=174260 RepID=A0A9X0CNE8_9CNID|nr:hypothetical protein OS493_034081 [Desmophyllum pertusum]